MDKILKVKINKKTCIDVLFVIVAVLYSGSAYAATDNTIYIYLKYLLAGIILFLFIIKKKWKIPIKNESSILPYWIILIWLMIVFFNYLVHMTLLDNLGGMLSLFFNFVIVYYIVCTISWKNFSNIYVKTIFAISVISLIFYFFVKDFTIIRNLLPIIGDGNNPTKYQGFLFYFFSNDNRNFGAFWEPGIFATHIILATLLLPYLKNGNKKIYIIVFTFALLSTSSSAGYAIFLIVILIWIQIKANDLNISKNIKFIFTFLVLMIGFSLYFFSEDLIYFFGLENNDIFAKLLDAENSQRALSVIYNWKLFLDSPVIGHGISGLQNSSYYLMADEMNIVIDTSTTFRHMATYGIFGLFYTIMFIYGILTNSYILKNCKILYVLVILLILNKEGQDAFLISWCILMYINFIPFKRHSELRRFA